MVKVLTLTARSRSGGLHAFCFTKNKAEIPNIATDDQGEVRSQNQYVVAPGSYVPPDEGKGTGFYTVEDALPPAGITFNDLPLIFREHFEKCMKASEEVEKRRKEVKPRTSTGPISAVFSVTAHDVVLREGGSVKASDRWGSIFHDSSTAANMSLSQKGKYLHCWRHSRAHNGLSCLAVLSGVISCESAGMPHKGSVGGNGVGDAEIFHAWLYAKTHNYIPENDSIPSRALKYIAEKHHGYQSKLNELLPRDIYRKTLLTVQEEY